MKETINRQEIPYFQVSNKLVDTDQLSNVYEKMCYIVMARYTNNGQAAFPSYSTIAKNMGVSRNTAIKSIKALTDKGVLTMKNKFIDGVQKSNTYTLNLLVGVQEVHYPSAGDALPPVQEMVTEEEQVDKEQDKKKQDKVIDLPFNSEEFKSIWNQWVQYRIETKNKLTPRSIIMQFNKFKGFNEKECIEAIELAIASGYKAIFPKKNNNQQTSSQHNPFKSILD